jgi:predicted Rossmann fold nucleotide-binding protein DprA/Smf involved in DNA uptake
MPSLLESASRNARGVNMIVAITGIRDLAPIDDGLVARAIYDACETATEMRFGGALGVDTIALLAALERGPRTRVFVPGKLSQQPASARRAAERADEVIELGLVAAPWAYLRRNDKMLEGAARCLGFTDGRETGGTAYTIRKARSLNIEVVRTLVRSA